MALILWVSQFVDATVTLLDVISLVERLGAVQEKQYCYSCSSLVAPCTHLRSIDNTVINIEIILTILFLSVSCTFIYLFIHSFFYSFIPIIFQIVTKHEIRTVDIAPNMSYIISNDPH